ncbi:MAG: hypothetical protein WC712_12245 [Candidatus Brocadiia bacterium]
MLKARLFAAFGLLMLCMPLAMLVAEDGNTTAPPNTVVYDETNNLQFVFQDHPLSELLNYITEKAGVNIVIDPESKLESLKVTANLRNVSWRNGLEYLAKKYEFEIEKSDEGVFVLRQPTRIDLVSDDSDIRTVLMMIAKEANVSIVIDPDVKGNVTVYMKQVPWTVALENVLRTTSFVAIKEKYNVILITTAAKLVDQPETRVFRLNYIEPGGAKYLPEIDSKYATKKDEKSMAATSLLEILEGIVGKEGLVKYENSNNCLVVRASKNKLEEVSKIIDELDREPLQVSIEVKIYSVSLAQIRDLGVKWANGLVLSANGASASNAVVFPFTNGFDSWEKYLHGAATRGPFFSSDPVITAGSIDASTLAMEVKLLETYTNAEVVQQPRITTLDNYAATIHVGDVIRYAEFSQSTSTSGSSTGGYKEAANSPVELGVQLLVIPHVARRDNNIMMTIIPKVEDARSGSLFEEFGSGATAIKLPQTKTELVVSKMIIPDGNTGVLAGFVKTTNAKNGNKIPLLGDIPGLGWLFKNRHEENTKSVMLIFITPTIISSERTRDVTKEFENIRKALEEEFTGKQAEAAKEEVGAGKAEVNKSDTKERPTVK